MKNNKLLNYAYLNSIPISIWQDGEPQAFGLIELHIKDAVRVNGMYYVKSQHEFRLEEAR